MSDSDAEAECLAREYPDLKTFRWPTPQEWLEAWNKLEPQIQEKMFDVNQKIYNEARRWLADRERR